MAERKLSKRSQRRLRQIVAQRLAVQPPKKPCLQQHSCSELTELSTDRDDSQDVPVLQKPTSSAGLAGPPPSPGPLSSPPSSPGPSCSPRLSPGPSTKGAQQHSDDEDHSDVRISSDEDAVSSEMSLSDSDESEQISYSLSDIDSEDPFQSTSIQGASGSGVPLYPDSCITEDGFNTVFLSLVQRHNLTYASQSDILKLFSILLPSPSKVPSSHVLISKFVNFKEDTIVQHFCGSCAQPIESGTTCDQQHCIRAQLPHAVFVRIPLHMQLKERFEGECA